MAENDFRFVLDMIPERWSDFEFWADYVSYQRENLERLIQMRKTLLDMRLVRAMRRYCSEVCISHCKK